MAEYDCSHAGLHGIDCKLRNCMQHVKRVRAYLYGLRLGQLVGPGLLIHISPHSPERGYLTQLPQNVRAADVTCVNDDVCGLQGSERLRTQKAVRVRYDTDEHNYDSGNTPGPLLTLRGELAARIWMGIAVDAFDDVSMEPDSRCTCGSLLFLWPARSISHRPLSLHPDSRSADE
jgi:hypothetical protein